MISFLYYNVQIYPTPPYPWNIFENDIPGFHGEHLKLPYFGLMKCKFIPPTNLIHLVLPVRCNGKLKFPLCYNCAITENSEECTCSISDRSFVHTYCTPEIEVAINVGYIIEEIFEVLHWAETEM